MRNRNRNRNRNGDTNGLNAAPIRNTSPTFLPNGEKTYNELLNSCEVTGVEHCELWDIDREFPLRFKPADEGENLINCTPRYSFTAASGSNDTTLVRPSGNFTSASVGALVHNVTNGGTSVIVSVSGGTATTLGSPFASGDVVRVYRFRITSLIDVANVSFEPNRAANDVALRFNGFGDSLVMVSDNTGTFGVNPRYRFTLNVTDYVSGALDVFGFNTTAPAFQANVKGGEVRGAGDFEYLLVLGGGLSPVLAVPATSEFSGVIELCNELYKVRTSYWYSINGNFTQFNASIFGMPIMAQHLIDMSEVEGLDECGNQICVYTEIENEGCALFNEVEQWLGVEESPTDACVFYDGQREALATELPCELQVGATYNFRVTLTGSGDVQFSIADALLGNQNNSPALVAPGFYEFSITVTMPPNIAAYLFAVAVSDGTESCFTLEMQKEGAQVVATPFMCSECYVFKPIDQCGMELKWYNDTPAFGIVKNTPQYAYPPARLRNPKIESISYDEEKGVDSFQRSFYANARKTEELSIAIVPPFVHNYMAVALMNRFFFVNAVQYVALENYEPDYSDDHESAKAVVKLAQSDQNDLVNPL